MEQENRLVVSYTIPYSDLEQLPKERLKQYMAEGSPLEFGHSLEDQIGGQIQAGLWIAGFYDDIQPNSILGRTIPSFCATLAIKR